MTLPLHTTVLIGATALAIAALFRGAISAPYDAPLPMRELLPIVWRPAAPDIAFALDTRLPRPVAPTVAEPAVSQYPIESTPGWLALLAQADGGDPHAACQLSVLLDDCRLAAEVGEMVETQISMAASEDTNVIANARDIALLETSIDPLHDACATVPADLVSQGWIYLLRAAIAGHEPSMFRFVTDLPVDPRQSGETSDAWSVYREHAALFIGLLLQRASPEALTLAFRAAQGAIFVGDRPIQTRDPAAVVRLGTALIELHEADPGSEENIAHALAELTDFESVRARAEGQRLADRFMQRRTSALPVALDSTLAEECSNGWPGMESEYTASSF